MLGSRSGTNATLSPADRGELHAVGAGEYSRDPIVNDDGVFYLVLAREAADQGVAAASRCSTAGLSILIGACPAERAPAAGRAHLLDTALLALLVLSFTRFAARSGVSAARALGACWCCCFRC